MLREQGEQAGSKGLELGLPKAPGKFQRPRDAQGARGARGVSWGFPEVSGGPRGPGMLRE